MELKTRFYEVLKRIFDIIVSLAIEHAIDRYFEKFNLKDLNDLL